MRKLTILWSRHLRVKYPEEKKDEKGNTKIEVNSGQQVYIDQLGFDF